MLENATDHENIRIVNFSLGFPYFLKFKAKGLFDRLIRFRARALARRCKPDIVWDFDNTGLFHDLREFSAKCRIFHPVDQLCSGSKKDKHADAVFSVGENILNCVVCNAPKQFIQHGLSGPFLEYGRTMLRQTKQYSLPADRPISIGYIGNLSSATIDRIAFKTIVQNHPQVQFELFGPFPKRDDSVACEEQDWRRFITTSKNCIVHGRRTPAEIVEQAHKIDGWLVCYDIENDINSCCNSHKILEYLATGRVVISNRITAYDGLNLICTPERLDNLELPNLFSRTIASLLEHNSSNNRQRRLSYAVENSYMSQIRIIQTKLNIPIDFPASR